MLSTDALVPCLPPLLPPCAGSPPAADGEPLVALMKFRHVFAFMKLDRDRFMIIKYYEYLFIYDLFIFMKLDHDGLMIVNSCPYELSKPRMKRCHS